MKAALLCSCMVVLAITGMAVGESVHDIICNQVFTGYKLDYRSRKCVRRRVRDCVNPFPYKTRHECMNDFRGEGNLCKPNPCKHGGVCQPVTTEKRGRTFKCDCIATGFYGRRCHRRCPRVLNKHSKQTACILI